MASSSGLTSRGVRTQSGTVMPAAGRAKSLALSSLNASAAVFSFA